MRIHGSLVDRVETAAKVPKEATPVFKTQEPDAPATIAEVEQEVAAATTKVNFDSNTWMICNRGILFSAEKRKWYRQYSSRNSAVR